MNFFGLIHFLSDFIYCDPGIREINKIVKRVDEDFCRDELRRRTRRREKRIVSQIDLSKYGIKPMKMYGVTFWFVEKIFDYFIDLEDALAEMGLCAVITIDGHVFIEPCDQIDEGHWYGDH